MARGKNKKQSNQVMDELVDSVAGLKDAFKSIAEELKVQITKNIEDADAATKRLSKSVSNDLTRAIRNYGKESEQLLDNQEKLAKGQLRSKDITKQIAKLVKEEARLKVDLEIAERNNLITATERASLENKLTELLEEQTTELKAQEIIADKLYKKRKKEEESLRRGIEGYMDVLSRVQKIPLLGSLINASKVQGKMNDYAKEYEERTGKVAGKWRTIGMGILETFNSIGKSLLNPLNLLTGFVTIVTAIIKMVLEWEQVTFDIAKNLGVSVEYAGKLRSEFAGMATGALLSKDIADSFGKLNEQLGFVGPATADFAKTAAQLEKRIGASAESMAQLATVGALTGKSLRDSYATVVGAAKVAGMQNKLRLTERQILEGIAKVSSTVLVNFKGNLPALAEAVVRAKKLGTTLDQIAKQGDALLDFETSIANQFEAEVLTGRELNLNRARELALAGKTYELGEELKTQGVTLAEYSQYNQYAKEATAATLGLSTEELSKQLILQKQATELGVQEGESMAKKQRILLKTAEGRKKLLEVMGQEGLANLEATSKAEELEATIARIKEKFAAMVSGPVLELVGKVTDWLSKSVNIEKVANVVKKVFEKMNGILENLPKYLKQAAEVLKIIAGLSIGVAVAKTIAAVASSTAGLLTGGIAAAAAGYLVYDYLNSIMPKFEHGGIVPGNSMTGDSVPIKVNSREMVLTQNQQKQLFDMANGGGGGNQKIEVTLNLDGERVTKSVINNLPASPRTSIDGRTSYPYT